MNHTPNEREFERRLAALLEAGTIRVDPNYSTWKSGVYAVVDCVFSAQAKYESMVLPMLRERLPARAGMEDAEGLTFAQFMADIDRFAPDRWDGYGRAVLNLQVLARRRKVEVCYDIAGFLAGRGLQTIGDLRGLGDEALSALVLGPLQSAVRGLGPALSRYLLILLGIESQIKPDTMILRLFGQLSSWAPEMGDASDIAVIERVIGSLAAEHGTTAARLDNAIWQFMSQGGELAPDAAPARRIGQHFELVDYKLLTSKQKETYNFQKLAAELADFGFTCIKLDDDWEGADFLAVEMQGDAILRVQLKARLTIAKKYAGKDLWLAFPHVGEWYLLEHDRLVGLVGEKTPWLESASWQNVGEYSSARPSKVLLLALAEFRLGVKED